jgi:hypothetical protein
MPERADSRIVQYLNTNLYHPRSSKHGDALCEFLLEDLLATCDSFRRLAEQDRIVYRANCTIDPASFDRWNADLVIGPPTQAPEPDATRVGSIAKGDPSEIWLAIDAKTIMTEHGKARRNRQRDLNAFHDILHRKNSRTVVGGLLLVNMAEQFHTPLAKKKKGATIHKGVVKLVSEIIELMGALPRHDEQSGRAGLEGMGIIVVAHSNVPGEQTRLIQEPPAPAENDPLSYRTFVRDLCSALSARYS